jgi:2-polyprenyl-3-methyl-5-hydroxy-6-metoxy-1,4-benzoquinol methylase
VQPEYSETISRYLNKINIKDLYKEFEQYIEYLPPCSAETKVLEIGCGEGYFLKYLSEKGYSDVLGIDLDIKALEHCKEMFASNVLCVDAVTFLKDIDDTYDAIVMNNVIEHFSKKELFTILTLIKKKLKIDGVFIAKTGNIENPLNLGLYLRDITHEIGFTINSLRQMMLMVGFENHKVKLFGIKYCSNNLLKTIIKRSASYIASTFIKLLAKCMSMRIDCMCKLIVCVSKK